MISTAVLFERFIGREEELRFFIDACSHSVREGKARTVFVAGEAGVGKSRLLSEFEEAIAKERGSFALSRCEDDGARPYRTLLEVLERLSAEPALRRRPALERAVAVLSSAGAIETKDAAGRRSVRLAAVRDALGDAAVRTGRLTIVIDDAQWVDYGSLEALGSVLTDVRRLPLMLVIAYRIEDLENDVSRASALAALQRTGGDRIALRPLSEHELLAPLRSLLPNASPATLKRVCELSEGKPYVAEELARNLIGYPERRDVEPTLSLRGAVLGRVASLEPAARAVLENAAVHGRVVRYADLFALGAVPDDVFPAIRAARNLQLVAETGDAAEAAFRFRHSITHDILYRELLILERRAIHSEIAAHLAGSGDARIAERAHHLAMAGDRAAAAAAFERAGDRAAEVTAFQDAATAFAKAASATSELGDLYRIGEKYVNTISGCGKYDGIVETIRPWRDRLRGAGRAHEAFCLGTSAMRMLAGYRAIETIELMHALQAEKPADATPEMIFEFERGVIYAYVLQHRFAEAAAAIARADWALRPKSPKQIMFLLSAQLTILYEWHGDRALAEQVTRQSHDLAIFMRDEAQIAKTTYNLALAAAERGAFAEAVRLCEEAERLWSVLGLSGFVSRAASLRANVYGMTGRFGDVRRLVAAADPADLDQHVWLLARRSTARAFGEDSVFFETARARAVENGDHMLTRDCSVHLAWVAPDAERARKALAATLAEPEGGVAEFDYAEAVIAFGSDDEAAFAVDCFRAAPRSGDELSDAQAQLIEARFAKRQHRPLASIEAARAAVPVFAKLGLWIEYANALVLAGERERAIAFLSGIGAVAERRRLGEPHREAAPALAFSGAELTQREEQVARLAAEGLSSRAVGERLRIGHRTVETHLTKVYEKLGIGSRGELAEYFLG